jgi:cytochrome c553
MTKRIGLSGFCVLVTFGGFFVPAVAGEDIDAKAQTCSLCHGQNGEPVEPNSIPVIWGQQESYLYKELHDYHSGDRMSPVMTPVVHDLSLLELRKMASYFATKTWPEQQHAGPGRPPNEKIAEKIVMCGSCHQQDFKGGAPAPRLAGLSYDYLVASMRAFADGGRTNNLDMPNFMHALTESERDSIARYLSAL